MKNIADRPLIFAQKLREAAQYLRDNPGQYDWNHCAKCNCGILARMFGVSKEVIEYNMIDNEDNAHFMWGHIANQHAKGKKNHIKSLIEAGFRLEDFNNIEMLAGIKIEMKPSYTCYSTLENIIKYFETWAQIIEDYNDAEIEGRELVKTDKITTKHSLINRDIPESARTALV